MNALRKEKRTADGYLAITDPEVGIGLVCEPLASRSTSVRYASWQVIFIYLRPNGVETANFRWHYGKN